MDVDHLGRCTGQLVPSWWLAACSVCGLVSWVGWWAVFWLVIRMVTYWLACLASGEQHPYGRSLDDCSFGCCSSGWILQVSGCISRVIDQLFVFGLVSRLGEGKTQIMKLFFSSGVLSNKR